MANEAKRDMQKRNVEVSRKDLISALKENREQHIKNYEEAMLGYKNSLLQKLEEGYKKACKDLDVRYEKVKRNVQDMQDEDIAKQRDYVTLVDAVTVEMRVPRCYSEEYDAAISIAEWDVRENLELTYAEFNCFVRDQWDWKSDFENVTKMYAGFAAKKG